MGDLLVLTVYHGTFGCASSFCKSNVDAKNDGPWKMYLRLQHMAILGINSFRFQGGIYTSKLRNPGEGSCYWSANPGFLLLFCF